MDLIELKCKCCGATVKKEDYAKSVTCSYCGTSYYAKKEEGKTTFSLTELTDTLFDKTSSDKREEKPYVNAPPRPNINKIILICLLIFCVPIGMLYVLFVRNTQFQWDIAFAKKTGRIPNRPKFNIILLIILFLLGVIPGIFYLIYKILMQIACDKEFS